MQGVRGRSTNHQADLNRHKILEYAKANPWFSVSEAARDLKMTRRVIRFYVNELIAKLMLTGRTRIQSTAARPPMEYRYQNNWLIVTESTDSVVKYHLKMLSEVADIYRQGLVPAFSTLPTVMEGLGDEIRILEERLTLLKMIYENPDMQNIKDFVKRMGN